MKQELRPVVHEMIQAQGLRYLLDVAHFIRTHSMQPTKILSLHASQVACIRKLKVGKENEFGRVFHLGRMGGNFMICFRSTSVRMNDKESFSDILAEFQSYFGAGTLSEVGTDKGYYSKKNIQAAESLSIRADGIQRPRVCSEPADPGSSL